jgi:hypothetical protein
VKNRGANRIDVLAMAIMKQAADDVRGAKTDGNPPSLANKLDALYWLAENGRDWCETLEIGLPVEQFHDWIEEQGRRLEEERRQMLWVRRLR